MRKLIVQEWMSLDGVFDADSMDKWWNPYESDERAAVIQSAIASAEGFILGRRTYEGLAPYWSSKKSNEMGVADKLNSAPKYVVSSTLKQGHWNNTTIIKGNAVNELSALKNASGKDLLLMGSAQLVRELMSKGVIDEFHFLVTPIVVGRGRHLFDDGAEATKMTLASSKILSKGVVALNYEPARA